MKDLYTFGKELLETNDLDPVYVVVYNADLPGGKEDRWLLAYWCFYHVGTASWISEGKGEDYWVRMGQAAGSKEWPRGSERRHFRGGAALKCVEWLKARGVDRLFQWFYERRTERIGVEEVLKYVRSWYLFGDWIAFKVADMLERLEIMPIDFPPESVFEMFDSPRKGAELLWEVEHGVPSAWEKEKVVAHWAIERIKHELEHHLAPPRYERPINIQEMETILCKWKSYMGGHYEVGKDIEEVQHGLLRFAKCTTAQALLKGGSKGGLW